MPELTEDRDRRAGKGLSDEVKAVYAALNKAGIANGPEHTDLGSTIFANMSGDGSPRRKSGFSPQQKICSNRSQNLRSGTHPRPERSNCRGRIQW